jgi:penicillin G amidase
MGCGAEWKSRIVTSMMRGRRTLGRYPLTVRLLSFVVLPLVVAASAGLVYLRCSVPGTATFLVPVGGRVEITRDSRGVAYINADRDTDAFFALGFAHAQDRLWQMELERRLAQGRLSEIFGKESVPRDAWMRTLGLYDSARSAWPMLSSEARTSLTAYAAGVNAWLKTDPVLPVEFLALGVRPEPWTELDSLAWAKIFALSLANNMKSEVASVVASQYLDGRQLADLMNLVPDDLAALSAARHGAAARAFRDIYSLNLQLESALKLGGMSVGSNAWAVSGKLTGSGSAVLANDTHLGLQIPSLWYVARLKGARLDVSGMTLVGLPVVVFGRNRDIAWGGTSMMADVQDLYAEQQNPSDPTQYQHDGRWEKFATHAELIAVRAAFPAALRDTVKPIEIQIRRTVDGPIVSDAVRVMDQPVALRWTALDPGDTSYESFYRLDYAHDWSSFQEAFRGYVAPALNLLYIDRSGNIGAIGVGRIPVRAKGRGRIPVPGWSGDFRWEGYIPFDELPRQFNPPSGYVASANNRNVDSAYPYLISEEWAPTERIARIGQMLNARIAAGEPLSVQYMMSMQADTVDAGAEKLASFLERREFAAERPRRAASYLRDWPGDMSADSQAAAIFFAWSKFLRERLFGAKLQGYWNRPQHADQLRAIIDGTTYDQILRALDGSSPGWCDPKTRGAGSCDAVIRQSLDQALAELEGLLGSNMQSWRWGRVHSTVYAHTPFSEVGVLAPLFERRIANGGSTNSINVAAGSYRDSVGYEQTFGPGFRQIIEMGAVGNVHFYMNSTGQSGNPLSRNYDDMVTPFRDVRYVKLEAVPPQHGFLTTLLPLQRR